MSNEQAGEEALPVNATMFPAAANLARGQNWYFAIMVQNAASRWGHA